MRLAAQAKGGFYPTPDRVVDMIADLVETPYIYGNNGETLRILDPCCGAGDAVAQLAERLDRPSTVPVETYGVELHRGPVGEGRGAADPLPLRRSVPDLHRQPRLRAAVPQPAL